MSAKSRTPRKSSVQGRGDRTRRSETPQTIPEGDEGTAEVPSTGGGDAQSPGQKVRAEEKVELQNLNTRLAAYIDRVRCLQDENNRLSVQVRSKEEVVTREVNAVKQTYEKELAELKVHCDAAIKEKASLQVEKRNLKTQNQELREQLQRTEKELKDREKELSSAQNRANDLSNKMNSVQAEADRAIADRRKIQDKLNDALKDLEAKKKDCEDLRAALNDADLKRVSTETELQNVRDQLDLSRNVHEQQVKEIRASKQVEISEVDTRLQKEYETRLQDSLVELREYYEDLLQNGREEADRVYEEKVKALKHDFDRKLNDAMSQREDVRQIKTRVEQLTRRLREKEDEAKHHEDRVRDMELQLANEKQRYDVMLNDKDDAIARLQKQVDELMKQLQDIMEENVRLDMEIATYRNLLEGEESRLNLTPGVDSGRPRRARSGRTRTPAAAARMEAASSPLSRLWPLSRASTSATPRSDSPLRKRKRTYESMISDERTEQSVRRSLGSSGEIEVMEVDPKGEFVRVRNKGAADVTMTGYSLKHAATGTLEEGGDGEIVYKFPRISLKAGATTTIWSGNTSVTHQAPDNLKMKEKWIMGKQNRTSLLDANDVEVAWFQIDHEVSSSAAVISTVGGGEELHHQRGDPNAQCCVM